MPRAGGGRAGGPDSDRPGPGSDFKLGQTRRRYEEQECPRNPGARGYGRVNSGTWFEAAQMRANRLAAEAGHDSKCAVAGLVWVSDASFGGKSMPWHGVYGA